MVKIFLPRVPAGRRQSGPNRSRWALLIGVLMALSTSAPVAAVEGGTVPGTVSVEAVVSCILVSGSYEFGTQPYSAGPPEPLASTTSADITNCGNRNAEVLVRGTSATGGSSSSVSWDLSSSAATDPCEVNQFGLAVSAGEAQPTPIGRVDSLFVSDIATEATVISTADLFMPCAGSTGAGETMTFSVIYTAVASDAPSATVQVHKSGTGFGQVTSEPAGIDCGPACSSSFTLGSDVSLEATPEPGSVFEGWSGGGCSGTSTCLVTLASDTTVAATFASQNVSLSVFRTGSGFGDVVSAPIGILCGSTCTASFAPSTVVTLTAIPRAGQIFAGWSGGGCAGLAPCVLTLSSSTNVVATFDSSVIPLTVTVSGPGSGTVTSNPHGINCGSLCSTNFEFGRQVILSAAAQPGSTFAGWTGDCSGTTSCVVIMTASRTVSATFSTAAP